MTEFGTLSNMVARHGLTLTVYPFFNGRYVFAARFSPTNDVCVVEDGMYVVAAGLGPDISSAISSLARRMNGRRIIRQTEDGLVELGMGIY